MTPHARASDVDIATVRASTPHANGQAQSFAPSTRVSPPSVSNSRHRVDIPQNRHGFLPERFGRTLSRPRARTRVARETLVLRERATPCARERGRKYKFKTARMCVTLFKTAGYVCPTGSPRPRVPRPAPWSRSALPKVPITNGWGVAKSHAPPTFYQSCTTYLASIKVYLIIYNTL